MDPLSTPTLDGAPPSPGDGSPDLAADDRSERDASERKLREQSLSGAVIVALLVFTVPLAMVEVVWAPTGGELDWSRRIQVAPFDAVLVLAAGWAILNSSFVVDLFRSTAVRIVSGLFVALFAISLAANFSWLGVALGANLFAGVCVMAACAAAARTARGRTILLTSVTAAGVVQAVLGMLQSIRGQTYGVAPIDFDWSLFAYGSSHAAQGGFPHPYHLTGFLIVCQGAALLGLRHTRTARWPWLASLLLITVATTITYSRAALIGQALVLLCAVLGRRDRRILLPAAAAISLGLLLGAVAFGDGWVARADASATSGDVDSGRRVRLEQAWTMIEDNPVVGVGPGRYSDELAKTVRDDVRPAHNLIAQEAAEYGVGGGILMVAFLGLIGLRALRGGAWTAMIVAAYVPMLLLGTIGYVLATSFAMSAIWLGLVRASLDPVDPEP